MTAGRFTFTGDFTVFLPGRDLRPHRAGSAAELTAGGTCPSPVPYVAGGDCHPTEQEE